MSVKYDTKYHNNLVLELNEISVESTLKLLHNDPRTERITTAPFFTALIVRCGMKINSIRRGRGEPALTLKEVKEKIFAECRKRHVMGAEKYGETTFLTKEPEVLLQDFIEEVADIINYDLYLTYNAAHNAPATEPLEEESHGD